MRIISLKNEFKYLIILLKMRVRFGEFFFFLLWNRIVLKIFFIKICRGDCYFRIRWENKTNTKSKQNCRISDISYRVLITYRTGSGARMRFRKTALAALGIRATPLSRVSWRNRRQRRRPQEAEHTLVRGLLTGRRPLWSRRRNETNAGFGRRRQRRRRRRDGWRDRTRSAVVDRIGPRGGSRECFFFFFLHFQL